MNWDSYEPFRLATTKHRIFVSYHHKDEYWRGQWDTNFNHMFNNVSVQAGEIDDENSAEYIKRVIQKEYITAASVLVVLVGPRTYCRKHIDWEISAALNAKVGGYSGLLGIFLPNHPNYAGSTYTPSLVPPRLVDNARSGYAPLHDWTYDSSTVRGWVEDAFSRRKSITEKIDNSRIQFTRNHCD